MCALCKAFEIYEKGQNIKEPLACVLKLEKFRKKNMKKYLKDFVLDFVNRNLIRCEVENFFEISMIFLSSIEYLDCLFSEFFPLFKANKKENLFFLTIKDYICKESLRFFIFFFNLFTTFF